MSLINKIAEKFKNIFVSYTNPIYLTNRAANIDSTYGPYELPVGVDTPTLDMLDSNAKDTLYPGKTFGIIINGQIVEYWAQLKDSVTGATGFNFDEAVKDNSNYELVIKQCVDLDDVEVIRIPASAIDVLFDDDPDDPAINPDYLQEQTEGTEGEVTFDPETPIDPGTIGGTEE